MADFTAITGQGVSGVIEGQKWHLGNHRMVEGLKKCSAKLEKLIFGLEKQSKSVVALIGSQGIEALFADVGASLLVAANGLRAMRK